MVEVPHRPERSPLPPVEAHPEPGPDPRDLPPIERLMRKMQDEPKTRRAVLTGATLALIGATLGISKLASGHAESHSSSEGNSEVFIPKPIFASLDREEGRLELSNVAEYWDSTFKFAQIAPGQRLYPPKFREFTTEEDFQEAGNKFIEADPLDLPDNAHLELMLSKRDNEIGPTEIPTSMPDPNNRSEALHLWGILVDSEGNPIDPKGEPAVEKFYVTSPIFFNLKSKIE